MILSLFYYSPAIAYLQHVHQSVLFFNILVSLMRNKTGNKNPFVMENCCPIVLGAGLEPAQP